MRFFGKLFCIFAFVCIYWPRPSLAYECDKRITTFVNPVRGRQLWLNNSVEAIVSQKDILSKYGFVATWLVQYDVLADKELVSFLDNNDDDEIGLFLEISEGLAKEAGVYYDQGQEWYFPNVVFLSGYERSDRRKLIDTAFNEFKNNFGYFPKSVGAWWLDSYSTQYMESKYGIEAVLIVADQKTTDNYGVWGQWWGWAYYPYSKNILVPSSNEQDLVVLQWAQRHPNLAYLGQGPMSSNHSLQANDYTSLGLGIKYFDETLSYYLDCRNKIGQITIGMETGMEGYKYMNEYSDQVEHINQLGLQSLTMSQFADEFKKSYPGGNPEIIFGDSDSQWTLNENYRQNIDLGEKLNYSDMVFADYFKADKNTFLDRNLYNLSDKDVSLHWPFFIVLFTALMIIASKLLNKPSRVVLVGLSTILTGLLIFRSYCGLGWCVYFGPTIENMALTQSLVLILLFALFWFISKYIDLSLYILSFGFLYVFSLFRYTQIDGVKMIGFIWNRFNLIGINEYFKIVNYDLGMLAKSVLKVDFDKIYSDWKLYLLALPVCQILVTFVLRVVLAKANKWLSMVVKIILFALMILYVYSLAISSPITVI